MFHCYLDSQLEGLKTKWLLEHLGDGSTRIDMHPLARDLCESEANGGELASRRCVYNDAEMFEEHVLPEHGAWKCMQRISLRGSGFRKELNLKYCTDVLVLKLVRCHIENHVLDRSPLTLLKSLEILSCTSSVSESSPVQVRGLGLLRNLLVLKWDDMPSGSPCIEEIGLLTKLQILELDSRDSDNKLPDVGRLRMLREATFRFGYGPVKISGLSGTMNTFRILDLGGCHRLLSCDGVGQLVALEELDLSDCLALEELPNLQNLTNLKKLDISGCRSITELPGLDELGWALRDLNLCDCSLLRKLPYLGKLKNLRKLEMRGCFELEELLGLGHCWALEELDLQGCSKLRRFDDQLGNLCHLRKVDISDCCLVESVPGLNDLICLQEFRAERCSGLVELPDLRKLSNLLVLNINLER
jgi:Leucine-rich repeat (LRR) protein